MIRKKMLNGGTPIARANTQVSFAEHLSRPAFSPESIRARARSVIERSVSSWVTALGVEPLLLRLLLLDVAEQQEQLDSETHRQGYVGVWPAYR